MANTASVSTATERDISQPHNLEQKFPGVSQGMAAFIRQIITNITNEGKQMSSFGFCQIICLLVVLFSLKVYLFKAYSRVFSKFGLNIILNIFTEI